MSIKLYSIPLDEFGWKMCLSGPKYWIIINFNNELQLLSAKRWSFPESASSNYISFGRFLPKPSYKC